MSLLVSDVRTEEFSKPPPKKKWLAEYIEKDSNNLEEKESEHISNDFNSDAKDFVRLFDNKMENLTLKNKLEQLSKNDLQQAPMTLSQEVIGGVVQGVLNQFNSFFENSCLKSDSASFQSKNGIVQSPKESVRLDNKLNISNLISNSQRMPTSIKSPPISTVISSVSELTTSSDPKISQHEIVPVVQSVISQFLNGSHGDSDFRRSRKRSHKHANCHRRDKASSGGHGAVERVQRSSSVIKFKSSSAVPPSVSAPSIESPTSNLQDEVLNLSLPKANTAGHNVSFASQDRCYSTESVKSLQVSKSQELTNLDRLSQSVTSEHDITHPPVIQHSTNLTSRPLTSWSSPMIVSASSVSEPFTKSLPCSRQSSPICLIKEPQIKRPGIYDSYSAPSSPPLQVPNTQRPISYNKSPLPSPPSLLLPHLQGPSGYSISPNPSPPSLQVPHIQKTSSFNTSTIPVQRPSSYNSSPISSPSSLPVPLVQRPICYNTSPIPSPPPLQVIQRTPSHLRLKSEVFSPEYTAIKPKSVKEISYSEVSLEPSNDQPKSEARKSNTREVHNRLEKNRRAQLKKCFDELANECDLDPKKASNLSVIKSAHKCVMALRRKERENEKTLASLVQEKIRRQQQLDLLKKEFPGYKSESDCD